MIGEKQFLRDIQPCSTSHVTFGDDVHGKVLGRGLLDVPRLPKLKDVLLVEGLKANLISISQLCDQDLFVKFTRGKCTVMDLSNQCIMEGTRSSDNYYLLSSSDTRYRSSAGDTELWHRRLGHLNF